VVSEEDRTHFLKATSLDGKKLSFLGPFEVKEIAFF